MQEIINLSYTYTDVKQYGHACVNMNPLLSYICAARFVELRVVNTMIELGANVDFCDLDEQTSLLCLLKRWHITDCNRRETLELLLYENVTLDERAVRFGLHVGEDYGIQRRLPVNLCGIYHTDAVEHSLFGYDSPENYALNFTVPLLLESGSPCPDDLLEDATKLSLHPSVIGYIRRYVTTPRSLQLCCRDSLRKRFQRRQIHAFLEVSKCPSKIKDFILLKSLLRCYKGKPLA